MISTAKCSLLPSLLERREQSGVVETTGGLPIRGCHEANFPLIGIALFSATLQCEAADSALLQTKHGEETHAVVTDIPDIVDMSCADPKTWDRLALAPPVNDWSSEVLVQGPGFKAAIAVIGMPLAK